MLTLNDAINELTEMYISGENGEEILTLLTEVRAAMEELIMAADPHANKSDLVVFDALNRARSILGERQEQQTDNTASQAAGAGEGKC